MSRPGGRYDPKSVEPEMYRLWEQGGYFHADPDPQRKPFTIVIPPPNVTGALHLGHALNNTLQDILIRARRMQGYNACWLPGTDHAGIATQAVVEKRLREQEGLTRHEVGREGLVQRIWKWKDEYANRILEQLRRLGCSCDWRRTRFTLDETCARAVYETFFRMFRDGLIFRGKRLVNWDCELQTAVADDEVYHETVCGHLWHIRYPILDGGECGRPARDADAQGAPAREGAQGKGKEPRAAEATRRTARPGKTAPPLDVRTIEEAIRRAARRDARAGIDYLVVATTRPETMLGDTAVAVHPGDERYRHLIGRYCLLPLMNRPIPIIADGMLVDPTFGTGCVKVTPGHDPNDYACAQRNGLPMINVLSPDGTINENGRSDKATDRRSDEAQCGRPVDGGSAGVPPARAGTEAGKDEGTEGSEPRASARGPSEPVAQATGPGHHARSGAPLHFDYAGLDRFEARKRVVADLEALGLLEKVEPYQTEIGHSERSKTPIEPMLSEQWFVKMDKLAEMAMEAVRDGRLRIIPKRFAKTYLDWLSEKRDWCISRQLWWGHRIPVWTFPEGCRSDGRHLRRSLDDLFRLEREGLIARQGPVPRAAWNPNLDDGARSLILTSFWSPRPDYHDEFDRLAQRLGLEQDPDVLDTWFSSALWPFSTFGWPNQSRDRKGAVSATSADEGTGLPDQNPSRQRGVNAEPADARPGARNEERLADARVSIHDGGASDQSHDRKGAVSATSGDEGTGLPDQNPSRQRGANAGTTDARPDAPDEEPLADPRVSDLDYFFPTSVLSTARDIISLWVARMVMTSLYLTKRVPFQHVYIHPTIQDGEGRRMSKSLGNGLDPLDLCDHYGTDAMRFVLASLAGATQDIRIPVAYLCPHCKRLTPQKREHLGKPLVACGACAKTFATRLADEQAIRQHGLGLALSERFEEGQKFCNKLWQAATGFVLPNLRSDEATKRRSDKGQGTRYEGTGTQGQATSTARTDPSTRLPTSEQSGLRVRPLTREDLALEDRWILSRLSACVAECNRRLEAYQFSDLVQTLYAFFWNEFCDWYVELVKPRLYDGQARRHEGAEVRREEENTTHARPSGGAEARNSAAAQGAAGFSPRGATNAQNAGLSGSSAAEAADSPDVARQVLAWVIDQTLRLLHPVIPFVTERIWQDLNRVAPQRGIREVRHIDRPLIVADWPTARPEDRDEAIERDMRRLQDVIRALREIRTTVNNMRSRAGQPAVRTLPRSLVRAERTTAEQLRSNLPMIRRLGSCDRVEIGPDMQKPPNSASKVLTGIEVYVPLEGLADPSVERERLTKERATLQRGIEQIERKLANENFVRRAPSEVVQRERARLAELKDRQARIEQSLRDIR